MKKIVLTCLLLSAFTLVSQKAKKTSYDFKQEILPVKLLSPEIKTFDFTVFYIQGPKSDVDKMGDKLNKAFGAIPLTQSQVLFKRNHYDLMKNAFTSLKFKDNKSYGIPGMMKSDNGGESHFKNLETPTNETDLTIKIEYADYDMIGKDLADNTYNLKLNFSFAKLSVVNNKTKEVIEDVSLFSNPLTYNFPLSYNTPSMTPLVFPNKLALDNGLNTALNSDLDSKIRQFLFNAMIKEASAYLSYNYNFGNVDTKFYFAYPKNEKLVEYKTAVSEMEKTTELITKNTKSATHLNWNDKEIQSQVNSLINKMESGLKLYAEKGKELEMSDEIADGFKLNLVSAYCLSNQFDLAEKKLFELNSSKSVYANEAQEILNGVAKANKYLTVYKTLFNWN